MTTTVTVLRSGQNTTVGSVSSRTEYSIAVSTGAQGVSVTAANVATGNLVLTLSNNSTIDAGSVAATVNTTVNTSAQYTWSNTHGFTANVAVKGIIANSSLGADGQVLTSNGTSTYWSNTANVATLTSNNTSFVGSVSAANVVSNSQLSSNLANYQTTAGLSANVATLTSNNASYLGGVAANQYAYANATVDRLTSNSYTYVLASNGVLTTTGNTTIATTNTGSNTSVKIAVHWNDPSASPAVNHVTSQWTFQHGGITFPDSTTQTTAYTGSITTDRLTSDANSVVLEANGQLTLPTNTVNNSVFTATSFEVANGSFNLNFVYENPHSNPSANVHFAYTFDTGGITVPVYYNFSTSNSFIEGAPDLLRIYGSSGNVAIWSNELIWSFENDGTLTLPSTNSAIVFSDATVQTTAFTGNTGGFEIGYKDVPQNYTNTSFTIALSDRGKHIYTANGTSQTITIANNSSVAFPIGTAISIVSQGAGTITVARGAGVSLYLAANSTSADRSIATYGMASLLKVGTDTWFISGAGVT
jgi:hypothetical protein